MTTSGPERVAPTCAGMRGGRRHLAVALIVVAMLVGGSVATSGASSAKRGAAHAHVETVEQHVDHVARPR